MNNNWITLCIQISRERSGLGIKIWESHGVHMDLEVSEDGEEDCEPGVKSSVNVWWKRLSKGDS